MSGHGRLTLWRSFAYAFRGAFLMLHTQRNARIHALATVAVVVLGALLGLGIGEWLWIVAAIAMVWVAEGLNTAIESLADAVSTEFHPRIRDAKDASAASVLLAAIAAAVIGALVFVPHLWALFAE